MGWNPFKEVGNFLNDITGTSSSARQQKKAQLELQHDAQNFAKWQMGNAHQMEVQDLQNAGLNPVLSSDGNGASAGVSAGNASTGTGTDPINMIMGIIQTMNNSAKTNADIQNETAKTNADINKILKEAGYTQKQIEYYNKYGVFPGATVKGGAFGVNAEIPVGLKLQQTTNSARTTNNWGQKYKNMNLWDKIKKQLKTK